MIAKLVKQWVTTYWPSTYLLLANKIYVLHMKGMLAENNGKILQIFKEEFNTEHQISQRSVKVSQQSF